MSTTDSLALIVAIVAVVGPLAGLIWYIINHRSEWKKIFLAGVVTVLVMAALLVGVNAVASHYAPSTPSPTPLPGTTQTVTAKASASPPPVATTIAENRPIPCAQNSCLVTIFLDKVVIDPSQRNMSWTFTLSSGPGCTATLDPYLEDPSGTQYRAGGQAADEFTIASGRSLDVVALFALLPTPGVAYQLHIGTGVSPGFECITGPSYGGNNYQTESFTF
jgi:hypothetical protein